MQDFFAVFVTGLQQCKISALSSSKKKKKGGGGGAGTIRTKREGRTWEYEVFSHIRSLYVSVSCTGGTALLHVPEHCTQSLHSYFNIMSRFCSIECNSAFQFLHICRCDLHLKYGLYVLHNELHENWRLDFTM